MTRVQLKKKNSRLIEVEEISDKLVPLLQLIVNDYGNRIMISDHKDEILQYFHGVTDSTYARLALLLKRYEQVELLTS